MSTYKVTVTREGKWWMVAIPEIDGLTQARRLGEVEDMAREYIAVSQGVDIDQVAVAIEVESVGGVTDVAARVAKIAAEREVVADLERNVIFESTVLARDLVAANVPLRDVGAILGVSHQRAHQLVTVQRK